MRIITRSAIDISESLASFLLASHIHYTHQRCDPVFEKRMKYVDTAKYTIADLYLPSKSVAFEVKSIEHGTSALKGCLQSSIYLEQVDKAVFCMQKPRRRKLAEAIESYCKSLNVGVVWIIGVPIICSEETIKKATGGNAKPFELWKKNRYIATKRAIMSKSRSDWADEYIATLEQVIRENHEQIFSFAVKPEPSGDGFSDIY